jgi:photosystem II stability/assembly factor-like uncharacterized protein
MKSLLRNRIGLFVTIQLLTILCYLDVVVTLAHSPHDVISTLEVSPTYYQDKTLFIIVLNRLLKSIDGGFSWKQLEKGLDNKSSLSSIKISPSYHYDKTLFLSSTGDGIYKSIDGGSSWHRGHDRLADLNVRFLSISPSYNSDNIVLAVGTKGGLHKTKNGGESWYQVIADNVKITAMDISSDLTKKYILVGDDKGVLYVSTDGGEVWQQNFRIPNASGSHSDFEA